MKHAILGVGAIGGLIGTALASLGKDVTVVVRPESLPGYPSNLSLDRPTGPLTAIVKVVAALTEPVDVLWIATKTYQLQSALEAVQVSLGCVVPLLNGVDHIAALARQFGRDRVIAATIAVEAEKAAPGRFVQRSSFVRLNLAASGETILGHLITRLRDIGFTCQFIPNEQTLLWSKLCFLGPLALVTSASGMNIGEIFANPDWKHKLITAINEASVVANASGAEIAPRQIQAFAESLPAGMRSSMQKDLAAGRELELDAIGGPILRGGKQYGIDVSIASELVATIRAKLH